MLNVLVMFIVVFLPCPFIDLFLYFVCAFYVFWGLLPLLGIDFQNIGLCVLCYFRGLLFFSPSSFIVSYSGMWFDFRILCLAFQKDWDFDPPSFIMFLNVFSIFSFSSCSIIVLSVSCVFMYSSFFCCILFCLCFMASSNSFRAIFLFVLAVFTSFEFFFFVDVFITFFPIVFVRACFMAISSSSYVVIFFLCYVLVCVCCTIAIFLLFLFSIWCFFLFVFALLCPISL